jgi:hypothetical protein
MKAGTSPATGSLESDKKLVTIGWMDGKEERAKT